MSALQINIILLLIISFSATLFGYILYVEYARFKHLSFIKNILSRKEDEINYLLEDKKKKLDEKTTLLDKLKIIMLHAGMDFSVYLFIFFFIVFVLAFGALFALFLKHWSGLLLGIPFGITIFYMVLQNIILRRKKEFNRALSTAISVLVKMMKNGIGFEQALSKSISVSNSKIFREIFSKFFQEKNTIGEVKAFKHLNKYISSKELSVFALAIKIGRESGGQFSNTLEKVEKTITYRKKMQDKVDVVTREGSVGSYLVVGIAIFLYFSLNGNFDGKLHAYFMNSEYGRIQLLGIALWIFIGMIVNKMITRIER